MQLLRDQFGFIG